MAHAKNEKRRAMKIWIKRVGKSRRNLPGELRPASIAEAYAAQEAYYRLAEAPPPQG
jgi:hypothetical protein